MKRLLILLCAVLLCGCAKEEEIVVPPLTETFSEINLETVTVYPIGSHCGGVRVSDRVAYVHPYNDKSEHVTVTCLLTSVNDWWNGIVSSFGDDTVVEKFDNFTMVTTPGGTTYAYRVLDTEHLVIVESTDLPSGYVRLVMEKLWFTDI